MKRAIYALFALAALSAALKPVYAATESSWVLVAVAFQGNEPVNSKIFSGIPTQVACKEAMVELAAMAKAAGVDIWSGCLEIVREKNLGDPKTKQKS